MTTEQYQAITSTAHYHVEETTWFTLEEARDQGARLGSEAYACWAECRYCPLHARFIRR